ncbi:GNAT family N-acetyltransferase [Streptomyces sp. DW26H14]|uniref:GNAT family N-acetyltransferase n=1 Tax=Streptomyces sp. DW26H14 TaxID=3435395 RepID=UPI00403E0985
MAVMTWQWHLTSDVAEFRAVAGGFLAAESVLCTMLLGVSETVRVAGPFAYDPGQRTAARFGWWCEGGAGPVAGVFAWTPPFVPLLGPMPGPAVGELPAALPGTPSAPVAGARGPATLVRSLARAYGHDADAGIDQRLRLFRLADPATRPPAPEGRARPALLAELPLVRDWFTAFGAVAPPGTASAGDIERRVGEGRLLLWEADGIPVSMAGRSATVLGQAKIAPVYTPEPLRGRGYAGAVAAAAGAAAIAAGAREVLLFTDLANPTSNALYPRIGYRPVAEFLSVVW